MATKPKIELAAEQNEGETKINSFGLEGKASLWEARKGQRASRRWDLGMDIGQWVGRPA